MSRRGAAVLAAAVALGAPASALAQSAGDEQYRDPFAGNGEQRDQSGSNGGGSDGNTGSGSPTPAPAPTTAPAPSQPTATAPPSGSEPVATTAGELPRTGAAAGWVAAIGVLLVAAGLRLRRTATA